jgi:predicted  nucleic acid-binding Zn-ribbon protein
MFTCLILWLQAEARASRLEADMRELKGRIRELEKENKRLEKEREKAEARAEHAASLSSEAAMKVRKSWGGAASIYFLLVLAFRLIHL